MENAGENNSDEDESFDNIRSPGLHSDLVPHAFDDTNRLENNASDVIEISQAMNEFFQFETDFPAYRMSSEKRTRHESTASIVDGLLSEIYDRWQDHRQDSFDSDTFTECSSTSEFVHWRRNSLYHDLEIGGRQIGYRLHRGVLLDYGEAELKNLASELARRVNQMSARLVRQLKRRERRMHKLQNNCDIITAIIQASSPKRRIDTRMKFSVEPSFGDNAFEQWKDAMKAVARLPLGIPEEFRKKVWLSLASHHIQDLKIDWDKTTKFAFNDKSNPDDNKLGLQIVKDLHRTGCSGFSGEDNEEERALLKRILLAYARWNKAVGYCQGFNVIAALLLEVMDRKEADALKVMIYLIDYVLPQSYFDNNLRALSVDMAVFRDLLKIFPKLSRHLDYLQHAQDQASGGCYEPPLTNVFTMQWFLTLFATCLPKSTVLRVWDCILLEGSEILLRTALTIWGKLSSRIQTVSTADEFYTLMGDLTQDMLEGNVLDADNMIKSIYSIAPFPFPQLTELREKYTYNIRPFTPAGKKSGWGEGHGLPSDEDDLEDEEIEAMTCFTGFIPMATTGSLKSRGLDGDQKSGSVPDISSLGPGAYGLGPADSAGAANVPAYMERMTTDISALKKQYAKLRQRQAQAHIILNSASSRQQTQKTKPIAPTIETPVAVNHLFLTKHAVKGKNRFVAASPRIANMYPVTPPYGVTNTASQRHVQPMNPQFNGDNKRGEKKTKWKEDRNNARNSPKDKVECDVVVDVEDVDKTNHRHVCSNSDQDDSGLGTSLSSPAHSYSSTDCSPKHSSNSGDNYSVKPGHSQLDCSPTHTSDKGDNESGITELYGHSQNLTEFYESTRDVWEAGDATEDNHDVTQTVGESTSVQENLGESNNGAYSDNRLTEQQDKQTEVLSTGDDIADSSNHNINTTQVDHPGGDTTLCNKTDSTDKTYSDDITQDSVNVTDNLRSYSDGANGRKSNLRSSNSSGSGADSDHLPEVFSPDYSNAHVKSFQQYYNNKRNLSVDSASSLEAQLKHCNLRKKVFNPFPVKHVNQNRAKTGIKLGLYKQATLEEFERNLKSQSVWGK